MGILEQFVEGRNSPVIRGFIFDPIQTHAGEATLSPDLVALHAASRIRCSQRRTVCPRYQRELRFRSSKPQTTVLRTSFRAASRAHEVLRTQYRHPASRVQLSNHEQPWALRRSARQTVLKTDSPPHTISGFVYDQIALTRKGTQPRFLILEFANAHDTAAQGRQLRSAQPNYLSALLQSKFRNTPPSRNRN